MLLSLNSAYAAPWGQDLLHDINLQLEPGQILGVLGPNGAGKDVLAEPAVWLDQPEPR